MSEISILIHGLDDKIKKLITLHNNLKEDNAQLISEINELKQINNDQTSIIKNIKGNNNIIKIADSINSTADTKEIRLRINEFVREIDKCIALLNK